MLIWISQNVKKIFEKNSIYIVLMCIYVSHLDHFKIREKYPKHLKSMDDVAVC